MDLARVVRVAAFLECVLVAAVLALGVVRMGMLLSPRVGFAPTAFDTTLRTQGHWLMFFVIVLQVVGAWMILPVMRGRMERASDVWSVAEPWIYGLAACAAGTLLVTFAMIEVLGRWG
jgi:hypothetical protein